MKIYLHVLVLTALMLLSGRIDSGSASAAPEAAVPLVLAENAAVNTKLTGRYEMDSRMGLGMLQVNASNTSLSYNLEINAATGSIREIASMELKGDVAENKGAIIKFFERKNSKDEKYVIAEFYSKTANGNVLLGKFAKKSQTQTDIPFDAIN